MKNEAETGPSVPASSERFGEHAEAMIFNSIFSHWSLTIARQIFGFSFTKHIGFYFANIKSGEDASTDIKIADLYLGFFLENFLIQNEVIFRQKNPQYPNLANSVATAVLREKKS